MFKKLLISLVVIASLAVSVSAQNNGPKLDPVINDSVLEIESRDTVIIPIVLKPYTFSIGPKVGGNYSLSGDPDGIDLGISGGIGYSAGMAFNIRFNRPEGGPFGTERLGVQLEALYSARSLANDVENIKMNCLEIPVLFQWYIRPSFALEAGPTFVGTISSSPQNLKYKTSVYLMDQIKTKDVMFSVGLNCKLTSGFTANLRYNMGNSDIAGNFQTKVSTISVGIGWLFTVIK